MCLCLLEPGVGIDDPSGPAHNEARRHGFYVEGFGRLPGRVERDDERR